MHSSQTGEVETPVVLVGPVAPAQEMALKTHRRLHSPATSEMQPPLPLPYVPIGGGSGAGPRNLHFQQVSLPPLWRGRGGALGVTLPEPPCLWFLFALSSDKEA